MGKASTKRKKAIQEGSAEQGRNLKSSKTSVTLQTKKEAQKSLSKTKLLLIILIISFAVYFNALFNDFVYDDSFQILENHWIKDIKYIPEIFSKSVWSFQRGEIISNYYRPLMHIIYMFNYHIFGFKPWGFHLVNILFHTGVSVMIFVTVLRLLKESQYSDPSSYLMPSFIASLLFATHPIHTEAVTWIAGLPDLSFTFFFLLSLYFYIRSTRDNLKGAYLLSVAFFFLSTLCKEPALTLLIILVAYDFTFRESGNRISNYMIRYVPYLIVAGVYFLLRFHALGDFAPEKKHAELSTYQYFINVFPLFMQYLEKLVLPINLNAFYVLHPIFSLFEAKGLLAFITTIVFVVLTIIAYGKNKSVFLSLLFIIVPLLPVLYIPVLGENTFTERYLYLSSFGFVLLLASLIRWAKINKPASDTMVAILFIVITGLYSCGTVNRNTVWKDDFSLYTDMVKKSPDGALPHSNLGKYFHDRGMIDEAIEQFQIVVKIAPNYADAYNNLGFAFFKKGWIDEAIEQYQIALKIDPEHARAHDNLGMGFFIKERIDEAIEQFQIALKTTPDLAGAHNNLGMAFLSKGWIDKAAEQFQIALRLNPDLADAHNNLGILYKNSGAIDRAIAEYQAAIRLNSDNLAYRTNLERAYEIKRLSR